jgi:hypothetical protein
MIKDSMFYIGLESGLKKKITNSLGNVPAPMGMAIITSYMLRLVVKWILLLV